jgi:DNA-binding response OmpR family regulator
MPSAQTILAVDDNPAFNYAICRTLQQAGYECLTAQTGSGAMSVAENGRPDLVLLDINLPDVNGFEVCRRLNVNQKTQAIPVIFLSAAQTSAHAKEMGKSVGADGFLFAPVETSQLLTVIEGVLLRSREARSA